MDHLHNTAFQSSPNGNSLGNFIEGTAESIEKINVGDVNGAMANIAGGDIVVVGTGVGYHDKLVEEVYAAYGNVAKSSESSGMVKSNGGGGESSPFIGSDVRYGFSLSLSLNLCSIALASALYSYYYSSNRTHTLWECILSPQQQHPPLLLLVVVFFIFHPAIDIYKQNSL